MEVKKRYFRIEMIIAILLAISIGFAIFISLIENFPLSIIFIIAVSFIFSILFNLLEKKYRGVEFRASRIILHTLGIFAVLFIFILYVPLSNRISLPVWIALILVNSLIAVVFVLTYTTPGVKRSIKRAHALPEDLNMRIRSLKERMGVDAEVYVFDGNEDKIANAMQIGAKGRYIFVSSYLLDNMPRESLLAVIAHELAHIKFRHVLKTSLIVDLIFFVMFNLYLLIPLFGVSGEELSICRLIIVWVPIIFIIVVLPFLRRRFERQADLEAARVVGVENMTNALEKLSDLALVPRKVSHIWNLSHPSIEDRIKMIREEKY